MPSTIIHNAKYHVNWRGLHLRDKDGYAYVCNGHLGDATANVPYITELWFGGVCVLNKRTAEWMRHTVASVDELHPNDNIPCEICTECMEAQGDNGL